MMTPEEVAAALALSPSQLCGAEWTRNRAKEWRKLALNGATLAVFTAIITVAAVIVAVISPMPIRLVWAAIALLAAILSQRTWRPMRAAFRASAAFAADKWPDHINRDGRR